MKYRVLLAPPPRENANPAEQIRQAADYIDAQR
jgi:hypothetical protein